MGKGAGKGGTDFFKQVQIDAGIKSEEDKTCLDKGEDWCDDTLGKNCGLTFLQRMIAFVSCVVIGYLISLTSFIRIKDCVKGDCAGFAIFYTLGNIIAVIGSFFLSGPCSQLKAMFEDGRLCASITFIFFLITTVVIAVVPGIEDGARVGIIVVCVLCQMVAYFWYTISFIPFARTIIKNCIKGMCPCCKGGGGGAA